MKLAIVEDEEKSVELLLDYIRKFEREKGVNLEAVCFRDGLSFLDHYQADFDIVFMDIEMPHLDGMTAAGKLRELDENVCLIFVTNLASYAIKGYEVDAMDFIVKPVRYFSFSLKLERAMKICMRRKKTELVLPAEENRRRLIIQDITYIEVKGHTLIYHTVSENTFSVRGTLSAEENKLSEKGFARCSNSFLVNMDRVTSVSKSSLMVGNEELPISRTQRVDFMRALADHVGNR